MDFYDRQDEIGELLRVQSSALTDHSRMTVVTGRRRIGKTSLIMQALAQGPADIPTVYLFVSRKSEAALCREFAEAASQQLGILVPTEITSFSRLIRVLLEAGRHQAYNLVVDEFQEFDSINRSVFSDLQNHWDQLRKQTKVNLVISGSVHSLMRKIFRDQKEPLFGRADNIIELKAFPVSTMKQVIADKRADFSPDDLLGLYSFTGGIPKYVEMLFDNTDLRLESMIGYMIRDNSPYLDEGRNLLITELGKSYGVYFSILQAVSGGATTLNQIATTVGQGSVSGHIARLTDDYQLLTRRRPILAKPNSHTARFEIDDNFLRFWFAFFEKHRSLIEIGNFEALRAIVERTYPSYSGFTLERYFKQQLAETKQFRDIGSWWEPKGDQNEIDIVALRLEPHQALIVEVKRQRGNFRLNRLQEKVEVLRTKVLAGYDFELRCMTLEDM